MAVCCRATINLCRACVAIAECSHSALLLLLLQVAAELDKGTLAEPPPGWIRPGEVADTAEESGSSGEPKQMLQLCLCGAFSVYSLQHRVTLRNNAWLQLAVVPGLAGTNKL
jgi:hypothetical protein